MSLYRDITETKQHLGVTRGIPYMSQPQRASPDAAPTQAAKAQWVEQQVAGQQRQDSEMITQVRLEEWPDKH